MAAAAQSNVVMDPAGDVWSSTSDLGYYWAGFGVGLSFLSFGFILRMARKTPGVTDY